MGLLWLTMICGVPNLLIGFEWRTLNLSLGLLIVFLLLSATVQFGFTFSSAYLSARTGETFMQMAARHFGRKGQHLLGLILFVSNAFWYALNATLLADSIVALNWWTMNRTLLVILIAVAMSVNNVLGFRGVAGFARYVAGPMLIVWVGIVLYRVSALPAQPIVHTPGPGMWLALGSISSFTIGTASWGNEADFWRHSDGRARAVALGVLGSIAIGLIIFPLTGWLMGVRLPSASSAQIINVMTSQTLNGSASLTLLLFAATYFACNDGILYGMIEWAEQTIPLPRWLLLLGIIIANALFSVLLQGHAHGLELVTAVSFVFLPAATVIMTYEDARSMREGRALFVETRDYHRAAFAGFAVAAGVGLCCSGLIPKLGALRVGIAPLWGWLAGLVCYALLRARLRTAA